MRATDPRRNLLDMFRRPAPADETSAELLAIAADLTTARDDAAAELSRLSAARPNLLLTADDAALDVADKATAVATRRRDRAEAALEALAPRIEAAKSREQEASLQELAAGGRRMQQRGVDLLAEYARLAGLISQTLSELAAINGTIMETNLRLALGGHDDLIIANPAEVVAKANGTETYRVDLTDRAFLPDPFRLFGNFWPKR